MKILSQATLFLLLFGLLTFASVPYRALASSDSVETSTIEQLLIPEAESTTDESAPPPSASTSDYADRNTDLGAQFTPETETPQLDLKAFALIGGLLLFIFILAVAFDKAWEKKEAYEREQQAKQSETDTE